MVVGMGVHRDDPGRSGCLSRALACFCVMGATISLAWQLQHSAWAKRVDLTRLPRVVVPWLAAVMRPLSFRPPARAQGRRTAAAVHSNDRRTTPPPTTLPGEETAGLRVHIVYATEFGNAEALAQILHRHLQSCGVRCRLINPGSWPHLDDYLFARARNKGSQMRLLPAHDGVVSADERAIYLFVVSTAGAGEPPTHFAPLFYMMESAAQRYAESVARPAANSSPTASLDAMNSVAVEAPVPGAMMTATATHPTAPSHRSPPFANIHFAVFGLGDSVYRNYCRCAIMTKTILKRGGATELHKMGFADASQEGNQEKVFMTWLASLVRALADYVAIAPETSADGHRQPEGQWALHYAAADEHAASSPYPLLCALRLSQRTALSPPRHEDGSAFYRLGLENAAAAAEETVSFEAGDHLAVYPRNPTPLVQRCARVLHLSDDTLSRVVVLTRRVSADGSEGGGGGGDGAGRRDVLPARVSLRAVLTYHIDLHARPRASMLRVLAQYCGDEKERGHFLRLLAGGDAAEAGGVIKKEDEAKNGARMCRPNMDEQLQKMSVSSCTAEDGTVRHSCEAGAAGVMTVVDYMERFPSCAVIPLAHFMEVMPRMQPRYYSIASDPVIHGGRLEVLIRKQRDGLGSHFLCQDCVLQSEPVYAFVRRSIFHLPTHRALSQPVIFIGPGTGVAGPLGLCHRRERALRERARQQAERTREWVRRQEELDEEDASVTGPCVFFFGAQHRNTEYVVAEEMERWTGEPTAMAAWDAAHAGHRVAAAACVLPLSDPLPCPIITLLDCAFSRDQAAKVYVTDLIMKHADYLYKLLTEGDGALIFVSGSAAGVGKEVDRRFTQLLQEKGNMTRLAAIQFLQSMERDHRYFKDVY